jgi:predicted nucleic acid-binding protein
VATPVVVPDASVLLKWVLRSPDEDDREPSLALKAAWLDGAVEIVVPTLWVFEVGNVLALKQAPLANMLLETLLDLELPEEPPRSYVARILALMRARSVTFYDAAYHALAIARGGTMVTADVRYVKKCRTAGHIATIGDWRP